MMLSKSVIFSFYISIILLFSGCGVGKNMTAPSDENFNVGHTSYSQSISMLGEPESVTDRLVRGKKIKDITYVYSSAGGEALASGVIPQKILTLTFSDQTLIGKSFISTYKIDNTDFDEFKIRELVKGKSTYQDMLRVLGIPNNHSIPPLSTSFEEFGYSYSQMRVSAFSKVKIFKKYATISFDNNKTISDIIYSSSGEK